MPNPLLPAHLPTTVTNGEIRDVLYRHIGGDLNASQVSRIVAGIAALFEREARHHADAIKALRDGSDHAIDELAERFDAMTTAARALVDGLANIPGPVNDLLADEIVQLRELIGTDDG